MIAIAGPGARRPLHPLHAILLAFPFPLFLGALLSDLAYWATFQVQWINFSSWLIAGGLFVGGFALLWALIDLFRSGTAAGGRSSISSCCSPCGCSASSTPSSTRRMPGRPCRRASICRRSWRSWRSLQPGSVIPGSVRERWNDAFVPSDRRPGDCPVRLRRRARAAAIWPQPGSARTAARPVARHGDRDAGKLGRRSPDGAAGLHDRRRSPPIS